MRTAQENGVDARATHKLFVGMGLHRGFVGVSPNDYLR